MSTEYRNFRKYTTWRAYCEAKGWRIRKVTTTIKYVRYIALLPGYGQIVGFFNDYFEDMSYGNVDLNPSPIKGLPIILIRK